MRQVDRMMVLIGEVVEVELMLQYGGGMKGRGMCGTSTRTCGFEQSPQGCQPRYDVISR